MKTKLTLLLIIAFMTAATAQESCHNYYPAVSPDGNYLYFLSDLSGQYLIYRANINGTNHQALLEGDQSVYAFRLSPDGSKIAFNYGPYNSTAEIYIMNSDGSNLTRLTENTVWDGNPSFSPDGQQIVFDAWDDSQYPEVYIMNIDGSGRTQLTNQGGAYWQSAPVFHPNGEKIYFEAGFNADNNIVSMDTDGSNWVNITQPNEFGYSDANIQFNADGSRLAFSTSEWGGYNGPRDIVTCNADGSDWLRLTNGDGDCRTPFYHPTEEKIYFADDRNIGNYYWDISVFNLDGSNLNRVFSCSNLGTNGTVEKNSLICYPNPMVTNSFIQCKLDEYDSYELKFADLLGKNYNISNQKTTEGIVIQRGNLASGIYFFTISSGTKVIGTGKLSVQ
jgi:Tol biopolymer transport system component